MKLLVKKYDRGQKFLSVTLPNGKKGYIPVDENDAAIEGAYGPNGRVKVYEKENLNSASKWMVLDREKPLVGIQRVPDDHYAALARDKAVDEYVDKVVGSSDNFTPWGLTGLSINFSLGKLMEALPESALKVLAKGRYISPSYWIDRASGLSDEQIMNGEGNLMGTGTGTIFDFTVAPTIMKQAGRGITRGVPYLVGKYKGNPGSLYDTYGPYNVQQYSPYVSKTTKKLVERPTIERVSIDAADDFANKVNLEEKVFNNPKTKTVVTLKDISDFYNKYGDLTEEEMLSLGILKPTPYGPLVTVNGKPVSYRNVFFKNKNRVYTKPEIAPKVQVIEEKPLLKGEARKKQLLEGWDKAAQSIEELKQEHPIPTETIQFSDVTELPLKKQIDRLYTSEGQTEQPIIWLEIQNNPELERFINEVGDKGVPINPETGEPIIATFDAEGNLVPTNRLASLLAYRTGENSKIGSVSSLTKDEPFIEGLRGTQLLLDRETLLPNGEAVEGGTKTFGELGFATDLLLAALNYADVLTHDLLLYVVNNLRARGYDIPAQSVDYAEALINNIRNKQIAEEIKLGRHKEEFRTGLKVPRAEFEETNGVGNTDAARMRGIWSSTETPVLSDWQDYINNMVRYNRFFGSKQGHGGVQTVLMRRPRYTWEKPIDMKGRRFNEPIPYKGKRYDDIHALETFLGNDSGFMGQDLINGRNPLLMRTLIAPRGSYFYGWGLKKGGKLIKKPKIKVTSSK